MSQMKLGVQNYTLRDLMAEDYFGTLERVRDLGLRYCEFAGLGGNSPDKVRAELDRIGLKAMGAHLMFDWDRPDVPAMVDEAKTIGYEYVVLPWIHEDRYKDGWARVAKDMEKVAAELRAAGMPFLYHNHAFEFKPEADGRLGIDVLYETASPDLVGAEVDVYWVQYGGVDPAEFIRRLGSRVRVAHLKDMSPAADRAFIECGRGTIDWDAVLAACDQAGTEYGIIELDVCPNPPLESVRVSTEFFRAKGLTL